MDKSQNLLYLEGSNFPFKLPQIRDFKYRKGIRKNIYFL